MKILYAQTTAIAAEAVDKAVKKMANKYVDVDLLKEEFKQTFDMQDLYLPAHFLDVVDGMPAADVQEVVRCKDCEYRKTEDCAMQYECECGAQYFWESDNAFCSWGRRNDGDPDAE